jgi:CheY-like chemotaxis protein
VNEGSQFFFTASFEESRAQEQEQPLQTPPADLEGLSVLVIDDNAANRMILREMLSRWGARVTEAEDGPRGLSKLENAHKSSKPYRLVLLDRLMPDMDGYEVVERIRSTPTISGVTIMMLTSDNQSGDIARARELGIEHYLVKPVKLSELMEVIRAAMGEKRPPVEALPSAAKPPMKEDRRALRILLVDDSEDNRFLVQAFLKKTPTG